MPARKCQLVATALVPALALGRTLGGPPTTFALFPRLVGVDDAIPFSLDLMQTVTVGSLITQPFARLSVAESCTKREDGPTWGVSPHRDWGVG